MLRSPGPQRTNTSNGIAAVAVEPTVVESSSVAALTAGCGMGGALCSLLDGVPFKVNSPILLCTTTRHFWRAAEEQIADSAEVASASKEELFEAFAPAPTSSAGCGTRRSPSTSKGSTGRRPTGRVPPSISPTAPPHCSPSSLVRGSCKPTAVAGAERLARLPRVHGQVGHAVARERAAGQQQAASAFLEAAAQKPPPPHALAGVPRVRQGRKSRSHNSAAKRR